MYAIKSPFTIESGAFSGLISLKSLYFPFFPFQYQVAYFLTDLFGENLLQHFHPIYSTQTIIFLNCMVMCSTYYQSTIHTLFPSTNHSE